MIPARDNISPATAPAAREVQRRRPWALTLATRLVILLAAALLGTGLVGPCMTIIPHFGELNSWVAFLRPASARPTTYSVLGGIMALMDHGHAGIGVLLLFFSCFFPSVKLAIMAWAVQALSERRPAGGLLEFAHHTGKFSMLDVLVLALIVVAIRGLPGRTQVVLGWGVWAFAASVILSLVASILLYRLNRVSRRGGT